MIKLKCDEEKDRRIDKMEKSRLLVICALGLGMLMVGCGSKDTQAVKQIEENKVEA